MVLLIWYNCLLCLSISCPLKNIRTDWNLPPQGSWEATSQASSESGAGSRTIKYCIRLLSAESERSQICSYPASRTSEPPSLGHTMWGRVRQTQGTFMCQLCGVPKSKCKTIRAVLQLNIERADVKSIRFFCETT